MKFELEITFAKPLIVMIETGPPAGLGKINQKLTQIMALLDDLQMRVSANTDVIKSVIVLLQGLKAKIDAAGVDEVKLKALSAALGDDTAALAAAVVEHTPADPA